MRLLFSDATMEIRRNHPWNAMPNEKNSPEASPGSLGARIRILRISLGFSQSGFATALGVSRREALLWERGDTLPSRPIAAAMVSLPGCPPERSFAWLQGKISLPEPVSPGSDSESRERTHDHQALYSGIRRISEEQGKYLKKLALIDEKGTTPLPFSSD